MINPMNMAGRTVLLTGASSGLGRAASVLLSNLGAQLILVGRDEERLNETAGQLEGPGHRVEPFDLMNVDEIPNWIRKLTAQTGLNGLVHSAGVQLTRPLRFLDDAHLTNVMKINLNAAVGLAKAFRQKGVYVPGGAIVFLSSVMGQVGQPGLAAYAASKGAVIALTKSLALELAREDIRVNCVAPGHVKTEMAEKVQESLSAEQIAAMEAMHPLGFGAPIDVAYAIAFLLSDTGRWITGSTLIVDGGYTAH